MKGRSHRLPVPSDPPDDWGDGSWTVDCSCGVTFDDGEEMVNCDECGVWVHTRCSRFVKGEASFACDKCKAKKPRPSSSAAAAIEAGHNNTYGGSAGATNTEETEVAQLLVDLPTKTDPCPPSASQRPPAFRLWSHVPIEERVHVQGVPGGDPSLFQGISSVFTSELWKCTGYVPKKFNFQYREFPCWDEEEKENPANRGADLLFSLSKEIVPYVPVDTFEQKPSPKAARRREGKGLGGGGGGRSQSCVKKDRNKIRVIGVHSGKRKKEESLGDKDQSGKKKARSVSDRAVPDSKKRGLIPLGDACISDNNGDGVLQSATADFENVKSEGMKEDVSLEPKLSNHCEGTDSSVKTKNILVVKTSSGVLSEEASRHKLPLEFPVKLKKDDECDPLRTGMSSRADVSAASSGEASDVAKVSVKEEDVSTAVDGLKQLNDESNLLGVLNGGSSSVAVEPEKSKSASGNPRRDAPGMLYASALSDSNPELPLSSKEVKVKVGSIGHDEQATCSSELLSFPVTDRKLESTEQLIEHSQRSSGHSSENVQVQETARGAPSCEPKSEEAEKELGLGNVDHDKISEGILSGSCECKQQEQELEESAGSLTAQEDSSEPRHGIKYEELTKSGGIYSQPPASGGHKLLVPVGKSSSSPSAPVFFKSAGSGTHKSAGSASSTAEKTIHSTKQRVKVKTHTFCEKDNATIALPGEQSTREIARQLAKTHQKGSALSGSKSSHISKISHSSASKLAFTDSKEQFTSSRTTSKTEKTMIFSGSGETIGSSQTQSASVQVKLMASGSSQKNEKMNQPISQQPSKLLKPSTVMHPPACLNTPPLSDEELALLLHQELNSSPRVPRVPRMRQAGGIQSASSGTTSMLSKRSSSSGGKDQNLVSRRKNKEDIRRDSHRSSHESVDETKKMDRLSSPDALASAKKNTQLSSTTGANAVPSSTEVNGQNILTVRNSPRNISDNDTGPHLRTLPGLINEIMSEGKCMTYEELCDAVLPHWKTLRKPNGERYAYSSHSQAVLDCLRNRNEWVHLIDRGPKTNSSRKRRKLDVEPPLSELENEEPRNKVSREEDKDVESHREDFPKGKRKARKRRRLALQGRGLKELRKRQKQDVSDDDLGSSSHSSDEGDQSIFSEDESQGARPHTVGSEATSSSSDGSD